VHRIAIAGLVALAAVFGATASAVAATAPTINTPAANSPATVLPTTVRPEATVTSSLVFGNRISCGSATKCLAVGSSVNSAGNSTPTAEALSGTKWKSVPVKTAKGAVATVLTGVSCKAATYCLVIGQYANSATTNFPYALTWNGTTLTPIAAPPMPKGNEGLSEISAVSCVAVKNCVATG
jgi:hypothetical protein